MTMTNQTLERKEQALQMIILLSALESWSFANQVMLPNYLHERLAETMGYLSKEVLHD